MLLSQHGDGSPSSPQLYIGYVQTLAETEIDDFNRQGMTAESCSLKESFLN